MRIMARLNYAQIGAALAEREPFQGNSMSAAYLPFDGTPPYTRDMPVMGSLPDHDREFLKSDLHTARTQGLAFYIVYSYSTPIAWAYGDTVRVPDVRYSVTTSKQQGKVRAYLR